MGGEVLKWRYLKHNQLMSLILVHTVQLKPMIKVQISGGMAFIGISDVVTASVYSEKTCEKKLMMMKMINIIISIMNESQETMIFYGRQKLTSAMKQIQKSDSRFKI